MSNKNSSKINSGIRKFLPERANLVFAVVPLLLFIFMLFRLTELHFFFQTWLDPVYAYLMNGLTFALGSNDIGHTDHPGTPLQIFIAVIIRIVGWFRGSNDLAADVLTHPESYLRIIAISLITLNCILLWVLGLYSYKSLKNKSMAVVLQLVPLMTFQLVNFLPIVACESFITFLSVAIAACIILFDGNVKNTNGLLIVIAILSALSIATKISTLSILIVPFFFFANAKSKTSYILLTLFFIILFLSPVLGKLGNFTGFMEKIATHTGKYGTGESKLFDIKIFFHSIQLMLLKEFPFTLHILLLPAGWVVIRKNNISGSLKRLYFAITLATVFQVVIVARHYSFHYLMPVFSLFMPLHVYFWFQIFRTKVYAVSGRIVSLIVIFLIAGVFTRLIVKNHFEKGIVNPVEKTTQAIHSEWKGNYIILTDGNNGAAFVESALKFGLSYSGGTMKERYATILASNYVGNYFWNSREGLTNWTGTHLPADVFSKNKQIFIYANTGNSQVSMSNISGMIDQTGMSGFVTLREVFQNEKTGEVIVSAIADTARIIKLNQPALILQTSMEEITKDGENFESIDEKFTFKGGKLQSHQFARSGVASILLTPANPFGLNIVIPVAIGKRFKAEFWQRISGQKQALVVASANNSDLFYKTSVHGFNRKGEWTRSELNVSLPESFPDKILHFYLYNPSSDSVWIDDFKLTVFE